MIDTVNEPRITYIYFRDFQIKYYSTLCKKYSTLSFNIQLDTYFISWCQESSKFLSKKNIES